MLFESLCRYLSIYKCKFIFRVVAILRDDRNGPLDGNYNFAFETADGVSRNEQGAPNGPNGAVTQQGGWR